MTHKRVYSVIAILLVAAISLSLLPSLSTPVVGAKTSTELKAELEALQQQKAENDARLEELQKEINNNRSDVDSIMKEKAAIEQQVQLLYEQLSIVNDQIATYSGLIAAKQVELDEANERYDQLNEAYKERIRAMEEAGELSYWSVLFKASSFSDFLDRLNMISEIASADSRRLQELKKAADDVAAAQQELENSKADLEKSRTQMQQTQAELDAKNAESNVILQQLLEKAGSLDELEDEFEQKEEEFLNQIADKKEEYNTQVQIEASIKASIQASSEAVRQASIQASKQASIQASKVQASIQASRDQISAPTGGGNSGIGTNNPSGVVWRVPCTYGRLSSPFGYRWHPVTGKWAMHNGVDLAAPKGTPIYATRSGIVVLATYDGTAGNYVKIDHQDSYQSIYMHMTHYVVKTGQYVYAGQLIGYVGSTGRSTGPHLHFGISRNGAYVNPMDYIG